MAYILKEDTVLNAVGLWKLIDQRRFCYTDKVNIINGVYGIRNLANGKFYIGSAAQKTGGIKSRWYHHITTLNKGEHDNYHLQNAWNKYGIKNFEFFIIEIIDYDGTKEKRAYIRQREEYYFHKYKSLDRKYGYNISKNAEGGGWGYTIEGIKNNRFKFSYEVFQKAMDYLINTNKTFMDIWRELNIQPNFLSNIYHRKLFKEEFKDVVFKERKTKAEEARDKKQKLYEQIEQIKKDLQAIPSLEGISEKYGVTNALMKDFLSENNIVIDKSCTKSNRVSGRRLKVYQYDLKGNFLMGFESISKAEQKWNIPNGKISECCLGKRKTTGGFRWSYYKQESLPPLTLIEQIFEKPLSSRFKPIIQFDKDFNIVNYYISYREAMRNGFYSLEWYLKQQNYEINKPYKGFVFKYAQDLTEEQLKKVLKFKEQKEDINNEQ